jgi:hypothetical protein
LGDFWGVRRIDPSLDDDKGTSLILLNSVKAQKVFQNKQKEIFTKECKLEQAISGNSCLVRPSIPSPQRQHFFLDFEQKPFNKVLNIYLPTKLNRQIQKVITLFK